MKKILLIIIVLPVFVVGFLVYDRTSQNITSIIPYPFRFSEKVYTDLDLDAPIVIIGDEMALRISSLKDRLIEKLSVNLSKPIKVQILANSGDNIHRTLEKLHSMKKFPLIIIYLGNMDQTYEYSFHTKYLKTSMANFRLYQNEKIKTSLMIFPYLSRVIYRPVPKIILGPKVTKDERVYQDDIFQKRMGFHYTLYQAAMEELLKLVKKRNGLIIPITTPINLETPPKQSCYGSYIEDSKERADELESLIKNENYKDALNLAHELALLNPSNARIHFLYSNVLKKLNQFGKFQEHGELAKAYDCKNRRANPIFNEILKKVSKIENIEYFDFHQYLIDELKENYVFLDDTYPQDVYIHNLLDFLAIKIKKRLRL